GRRGGAARGFGEAGPVPREALVAGCGRCRGPCPRAEVARRYGLGPGVVAGALRRLAAQDRVGEGEFLPGGRGTEWCDTEVLRLLRRRCLARLRKEAEPVPPEAPGAFLPAWQNAGPPAPARGRLPRPRQGPRSRRTGAGNRGG